MTEPYRSATLDARRAQMFPVLAEEDLARLRRFGAPRRYAPGERLFETGKPGAGMFVVLSGMLRITGRDGHGRDLLIADVSAGGFSGEVGQLSGRRYLADGVALGEVEALLIAPERLRALLVAEADLGEQIMRAFILRRVGLIETGAGGPVLIGAPGSPDVLRLRNFLARNGQPHQFFDPADDEDAHALLQTGARDGQRTLETSVPGVFAIGDVRAGSVKRVGGAIGEGAAVVAQVHAFLAAHA